MNTRLPAIDGRSSAEQFMQEHDLLKRQVMVLTDENSSMKEQVHQSENLNMVQARQIDALNNQIREEQARTRAWLSYTMKLTGQLDAIKAVIESSQQIGRLAAQESQKHTMEEQMSDDDKADLARIVGTKPPQNRLT